MIVVGPAATLAASPLVIGSMRAAKKSAVLIFALCSGVSPAEAASAMRVHIQPKLTSEKSLRYSTAAAPRLSSVARLEACGRGLQQFERLGVADAIRTVSTVRPASAISAETNAKNALAIPPPAMAILRPTRSIACTPFVPS